MKTVGVIGGVGPETTAEFYLELIFGCYQKNKVSRPPILIWNIPLPYKIEEDLITKSEGEERYVPYLIEAAQLLEKSGADFLVMPCNSLHIFIDKIRKSVKIPVLSIVEETAKFLKSHSISQVGILATSTTIKRGLYEKALKEQGIGLVVPDGFQQAKIGKVINNIVLNRHANKDRQEFIKIVDSLNGSVSDIILACTDLQLLIPSHGAVKIHDTMKIFADSTVNTILM